MMVELMSLIALAKIGKLKVLKELFGEIIIPKAIWYVFLRI